MPESGASSTSYYQLLGVMPTASVQEIRRAYRELSKLYHPDTTTLPAAIATVKFQALNEAYGTLSSPEKRAAYDLQQGYSRVNVIQAPADFNRPVSEARKIRSTSYLGPSDRPLSAGELFAVFILGLTFIGCLLLVVTIGLTRGDVALQSVKSDPLVQTVLEQIPVLPHPEQPDSSIPNRPDAGVTSSSEQPTAPAERRSNPALPVPASPKPDGNPT